MPKAKPGYQRNFLTPAESFYEVTRGKPRAKTSRAAGGFTKPPTTLPICLQITAEKARKIVGISAAIADRGCRRQ